MFVVAEQTRSGEIRLHTAAQIRFDPGNGGYISGLHDKGNSTFGLPIGHVVAIKQVAPMPDVDRLMPDEQKLQNVKDWLDERISEANQPGRDTSFVVHQALSAVRNLAEGWTYHKTDVTLPRLKP